MVDNTHIKTCFVKSLVKWLAICTLEGALSKRLEKKIKVHNWFSEDRMPNMAYGWLVGSKGHIYVSTNKKVDNMHIMGCYVKMFGN